MLYLTVIRLGQATALKRRRTEHNEALKGRVAYLTVDAQANVDVEIHKLLNIDSFVILVNSQLTYSQNVWTAIIDLKKVQEALLWLKKQLFSIFFS